MRFHAKHVSVGESGGEYFQVSFDNEDPSDDDLDLSPPNQPYLLVQRQFEDDDGGVCYIETLDHDTYTATSACGSLSSHPYASPSRSPGRTTNTRDLVIEAPPGQVGAARLGSIRDGRDASSPGLRVALETADCPPSLPGHALRLGGPWGAHTAALVLADGAPLQLALRACCPVCGQPCRVLLLGKPGWTCRPCSGAPWPSWAKPRLLRRDEAAAEAVRPRQPGERLDAARRRWSHGLAAYKTLKGADATLEPELAADASPLPERLRYRPLGGAAWRLLMLPVGAVVRLRGHPALMPIDVIALALVDRALGGNIRAAKLLFDLIEGPSAARPELPPTVGLAPEAIEAIVRYLNERPAPPAAGITH